MITTRGRYALRVLIDLAENGSEKYIPMKEIAARQYLSLKYLEQIMPVLIKNRIIDGASGRGGGYRLTRSPEEYSVGEILRLTEGSLSPVACLDCNKKEKCRHEAECRTLPMWKKFDEITNDYFNGISIADLMKDNKN